MTALFALLSSVGSSQESREAPGKASGRFSTVVSIGETSREVLIQLYHFRILEEEFYFQSIQELVLSITQRNAIFLMSVSVVFMLSSTK